MNKNALSKFAHTRSQVGQGFSEYSVVIVFVVVLVSVVVKVFGEQLAILVNRSMALFH